MEFCLGIAVGMLLLLVVEYRVRAILDRIRRDKAMEGVVGETPEPEPVINEIKTKSRTMWDRPDPFVPKDK